MLIAIWKTSILHSITYQADYAPCISVVQNESKVSVQKFEDGEGTD